MRPFFMLLGQFTDYHFINELRFLKGTLKHNVYLKPIHSGSAFVGDHLIERIRQYIPPIQLSIQTIEPPARFRFYFPI